MDAGILCRQRRHRVVVTDGVQPHPGMDIATGLVGQRYVFVGRLVLVPENGQVNLGTYPKGNCRPRHRAGTRATVHGVIDPITLGEGAEVRIPLAIGALIAQPLGFDPAFVHSPATMVDPVVHPDGLCRLDRPGADVQCDSLPRAYSMGRAGRVGGQMPDLHLSAPIHIP